jgi:hypothetical protein
MSDLTKIKSYVEQLIRTSPGDGAFLVITVNGTEDFLQMTGDTSGVQLNFPLITARQMSMESNIRAVAERNGFVLVENKGSDGSRFLDINLSANASEAARVSEILLREVFRVADATKLDFEGDGIEFK